MLGRNTKQTSYARSERSSRQQTSEEAKSLRECSTVIQILVVSACKSLNMVKIVCDFNADILFTKNAWTDMSMVTTKANLSPTSDQPKTLAAPPAEGVLR
jgi:hypothetical protein